MDLNVLSSGYALEAEAVSEKIIYFDKEFEIVRQKDISVGNVVFTKSGQALCQSIDVDMIEGFWETYCLPFWKEHNKEENGNTLATEISKLK
ncbi:MAG: DUF2806 domain-containing protein [Clostridium sp.]|nr:DUF2806 domain-containing protein [Roseburia sp.]MCM1099208.1 DUF2806 domain-containing protein [Ruminococcus flavefaciens]MCM1181674.1 DUF2806 domain-containing protein [Clostridium sp.]